MADPVIPMRGFTCAVSRNDAAPAPGFGFGGVAVGIDETGGDRRYALALRHPDGTVLTGFLSDALLDRLALRLANLIDEDAVPLGSAVVH